MGNSVGGAPAGRDAGGVVGSTWPYPGENSYYIPASSDPVRANAPFTPATSNAGPTANVDLLGIAVLAGLVLAFEWFRKGR